MKNFEPNLKKVATVMKSLTMRKSNDPDDSDDLMSSSTGSEGEGGGSAMGRTFSF